MTPPTQRSSPDVLDEALANYRGDPRLVRFVITRLMKAALAIDLDPFADAATIANDPTLSQLVSAPGELQGVLGVDREETT